MNCPIGIFSHGKFRLLSQRKASSDGHTTQPIVHAGCFSVSIIHQTLTWTTGLQSALKVGPGRKIPCCTGESNLRQQRVGPMLYRLSYIPTVCK